MCFIFTKIGSVCTGPFEHLSYVNEYQNGDPVIFFPSSQLKISFNESSLQSTFEYPSESSIWDSGEEEEVEGGGGGGGEEVGVSVERIHIPRPSYTSSPTAHSPNSTGETARK